MKRLFLSVFLGLATAPLLFAQNGTFTVPGTQFFFTPGNPPPDVDAMNFLVPNGVTLGVDLTTLNLSSGTSLGDVQSTTVYTTKDTLNYTNYGTLMGIPGFDFEYFASDPPPPQPGVPFSTMAGTFANIANGPAGGSIFCTNIFAGFGLVPPFSPLAGPDPTTINGLATLKVNATNIFDSGLMSMDNTGLIDLRGENLDLRRGNFSLLSGLSAAGYDILDWGSGGFGTNTGAWSPATQLTPTTASSPIFLSSLNFFIDQMSLNNSTPYFQSLNPPVIGATQVWRAIFLQDFSPTNVTKNVYFGSLLGLGSGEFTIEWVGTYPDAVTGAIRTNYFYLNDVPEIRRSTNFSFLLPPDTQSQPFGEFTLSESAVKQQLGAPNPTSYINNWPLIVTNDFGYLSVLPTPFVVTNEVVGGSCTNVPGRVQFTSSQTMNLANTRVTGPNYLLLSAPSNYLGNTNSLISSAFADLNLGVTNTSFTISNLLNPNIPVWTGLTNQPSAVLGQPMGGLQVWSGSFLFNVTNAAGQTITNDVRIMLVNSALQPTSPAEQQNVNLHTPHDLVISDQLNIFGSFSSDAQTLTLTTNTSGAFSLDGHLDLLSDNIFWSSSLPDLQFLTNWGEIDAQNEVFFAGNITSPYSDLNSATFYQAFINHGIITNQSTFVRTGAFENSGVISEAPGGSIDIVASSAAVATNGQFLAPGGYVSISADSLLASNGIIVAGGGPLTLNIGCSLSDGYIFGNQFAQFTNSMFPHVVTNGNFWTTDGGINVPAMPQSGTADLLGTTITNIAMNNFVSPNVWPAKDLGPGPIPYGFGDNLAVGRMMLNADSTSVFNFIPANGSSNAIYIDSIELQGNTTNTDGNGNPLSVAIQPGMNIYYAEAIENGVSIAEKLNGKFGADNTNVNAGRFFWVTNYAGVYSSTNILYPDGNTYIFNHALAISPDINSGGPDGSEITNQFLVNANNPFPIPTNIMYPIPVEGPQTCAVVGNNPGGNPTNGPGPGTILVPAHLTLPPEAPASIVGGSNAPIVFSIAAGSYNGLFYDANAVTPSSSGYFSATVTSKGGFSAKLQLGSHSYSFSGVFDSSGSAVVNNVTGKGLQTLSVSLQLVNNDVITGSVSSGNNWVAQLQADRAGFTSRIGTSSAGKETLLLGSDDGNSTTATGDGFGTATISVAGGVQLSATLPDGVKITQKSALSKTGVWPVYSSLYGGTGVFIGWMRCTNQINIVGSAVWEMPGGPGGLYPGGLTNQIDASGTRLQGRVGFSGTGSAVLSGAGLGTSLTNKVMVIGKNVSSPNMKFSVNPQTGLFSGSVTVPDSSQKLLFQGALLENNGTGGGFFLNADQSGKVYFGPAN